MKAKAKVDRVYSINLGQGNLITLTLAKACKLPRIHTLLAQHVYTTH